MSAAIVVGTDGSESATKAVTRAAQLAKLAGVPLHIVTAYGREPQPVPEDLGWLDTAGAQADTIMQQAADEVRAEGVEVQLHAKVGDPADVLIDVASEVDAGLIVVGNKGMSGVARFLLGSVPNKVAHHAPCDVLIVRTV